MVWANYVIFDTRAACTPARMYKIWINKSRLYKGTTEETFSRKITYAEQVVYVTVFQINTFMMRVYEIYQLFDIKYIP